MTTTTQAQPKISFQKVSRRFGDGGKTFLALDRLSLDIADGEFVTVVGPSGCGKSTAMNMPPGWPKSRTARYSWMASLCMDPAPERGVIFQQYALFPWLTVRQNVEFGLRIKGMPTAERRRISIISSISSASRFRRRTTENSFGRHGSSAAPLPAPMPSIRRYC
jgi:NitT/TauT family transport system ATP-binding protein